VTARLLVGDVFDRMAELEDASVDLVLTSPPFLALRSYLPSDHPDKAKEIGSEPTPAAFLDTLLALTAEWRRVLAPHGSICVELGDTYSGSGGAGGDYAEGGLRDGQEAFAGSAHKAKNNRHNQPDAGPRTGPGRTTVGHEGWPLPKSLCGIPHLYHLSLAYGRNLLTGEPSPAGEWRVRNVVAWCRPNPPVGALGDKFRPGTSYMTVACVSGQRYFDLDAVRSTEPNPNTHARTAKGVDVRPNDTKSADDERTGGNRSTLAIQHLSAGAPPLDWWEIPTQPYAGSHYATWPAALCERPIKAMCPQRVCTTCGEPSRRIVDAFTLDSYRASDRPQTMKAVALADEHGLTDEHIAAVRAFGTSDAGKAVDLNTGAGRNTDTVKALAAEAKTVLGGYFREFVQSTTATRTSTWSDCGHDTWRTGIVLDPFAGSGTTLAVATGHGRDAIGIDLDARNADLCAERVGMFLEVDHGKAIA
jgi:hypothetical protein